MFSIVCLFLETKRNDNRFHGTVSIHGFSNISKNNEIYLLLSTFSTNMNKSSFPFALPTTVLMRLIFSSPCNALSGTQLIQQKRKYETHRVKRNISILFQNLLKLFIGLEKTGSHSCIHLSSIRLYASKHNVT